ncbi:hypothetical protein SLS62_000721 [Diatrype stigma]|uniref:Uncharacterized protein n=1 Tax=Diatrype stigma TaxID=117547 RepID=A0AAN9YWG8_9PEZI
MRNIQVCEMLRYVCFALALREDSAMSLALAASAASTAPPIRKPCLFETTNALAHYTASLGFVRERLGRAINVGHNEIIATVVGVAAYDLSLGRFDRWVVHMAGLRDMIERQGGLETINSYPMRLAITWTELVGSLRLDMPSPIAAALVDATKGSLPKHEASPALAWTVAVLQARSAPQQQHHLLSDICRVLKSLSDLAQLFSGRDLSRWLDDSSLGEPLSIVLSEALALPRLGGIIPPPPPPRGGGDEEGDGDGNGASGVTAAAAEAAAVNLTIREVLRLTSLLLLVGPVDSFACNGDLAYNLRGRVPMLLRDLEALQRERPGAGWDWAVAGLEELELWVLVVGALAEVDGAEEKAWAVSRLRRVVRARRLGWDQVLDALRQIAWFEEGVLAEGMEELRMEVEDVVVD